MVNKGRLLIREAGHVIAEILEGAGLRVERLVSGPHTASERQSDLTVDAASGRTRFRFGVEVRSRITPQTALSTSETARRHTAGAIPVVFAPVISPRVADVLREQGVGYVDRAGNCWLKSRASNLLIERRGLRSEPEPTAAAADPFSPKSSRIVRLMLSQPEVGWQVRKLAEHPDVRVSPGLVVKVKRSLVEEGYAVERDRKLYLRDPIGLLNAWAAQYSDPVEKIPIYIRGDAAAAEETAGKWCRDNAIQFALAGFSAAWRLAPDVRYSVATIFVEERGFERSMLEQLRTRYGGKTVDTGPNLFLWRPYDPSVLAFSETGGQGEPITSAVQTYLDLKHAGGRGDEAAKAVFEKHLKPLFDESTARAQEHQRGPN